MDPFAAILNPPDETPVAREKRLQEEEEAKQVSNRIDDWIKQEKQQLAAKEEKGGVVRILLLGQSESGKSTLQRQFTLVHAPKTFDAERPGWRLVIFLNVVRSVQRILMTLNDLFLKPDGGDPGSSNSISSHIPSHLSISPSCSPKNSEDYVREMTLKLSPITNLEDAIISRLLGPGEYQQAKQNQSLIAAGVVSGGGLHGVLETKNQEFFVRPNFGSKYGEGLFGKLRRGVDRLTRQTTNGDVGAIDWDDRKDPGRIMHMCGEDIQALWGNDWVRAQLRQKNVRLEEDSGFFLNDLARVVGPRYIPTDSDILRARIKTVGVSEHVFPKGKEGIEWRIYDVGGARSQRQAWAPFFDQVNSVIFLAPLSPFDTTLADDRRVNALEDSFLMWRELCSNKILTKVPLVLFLNKSDLLKKKLEDGIKVAKFVVSYDDRPNTPESVEKYFRSKFEAIRKQCTPLSRPVFIHVTTCIDQQTTKSIISDIQDVLMRRNLQGASLV